MTVGRCGDTADIALSRTRVRVIPDSEFLTFFSAFFLSLLILSASLFAPSAKAQDAKPGVVGFGDLVVTGASGTLPPPANPPLPPGVNQLDETFINPDSPSLKVFDVRNPGGPAQAQLLNAPTKYQAAARDIGQVFGLALDKSTPTNIFAASTSVHGLQIVVPDADGDGRPERIKLGQPGAQWMDGQFGMARGGGPGTVWKINGETGEITKFADILGGGAPNSGPGLGNIAYDAKRKQLFVSDLDTGLIHRLDMAGTDLGTFDHGLQGRPANGMAAAADDAVRADITSPAFDAEDRGSWGLTAPERRVWGLAVRGDRLYYAVETGPQIWSVGINEDGGFGGDPRWELDVPSDPNAYPVSDIAFQSNGQMLMAQRGGIVSRYDYSQYHTPRKTRVLRFALESPDDAATPSRWVAVPDDYAIGFPGIHRNTSGGIAIGYGYKKNADGSYGLGSCEGTLWSTGDALRDNPVHGAKLAQGGPLNVHGLQGNALSLVRPQNVPPWESYYVDFDGQFDDPQASGHVGDVEIPRECGRKQVMDLRIHKHAIAERCTAGNQCPFIVEFENTGTETYTGPLQFEDISHTGGKLVGHAPPDWTCEEVFAGSGVYQCNYPEVTLAPGEKTSIELTIQLPPWWDRPVYDNCVQMLVPGGGIDQRPYNNRSCDYVPVGGPGVHLGGPDLLLEKFAYFWNCDFFGICTFAVRITNVGASPYTGPLSIHDTLSQPGASLIDWGPQPQWICAAGGVAGSYDCSRPAPVTLLPGEFREVILHVQAPPIAAGHTHVHNCAYIEWADPRDANPFNEYDCAAISIFPPGHPLARAKLEIDKKAAFVCSPPPAGPGGGWACNYKVTITNTGGAPYGEEIVVTDVTDPIGAGPGDLVDYGNNPPWTCVPGAGPASQTCKRPPGLLPGESVQLRVRFEVPAATPTPNALKNCAKISHDNDGDGVPEDIEDCDFALICTPGAGGNCPPDIAVDKRVDVDTCWPDFDCKFLVRFQNLGGAAHPAGLVIHDIPNPNAGPLSLPGVPPAFFSCAPVGTNYDCTLHVAIPPGAAGTVPFVFPVPNDYPWTTLKNCAKVDPSANNILSINDEGCDTAFIPGPDLAPFGGTECTLGVPCPLDVTIDNKGLRPFKGAAGLKGALSPAVPITSIISQTAGLSCSVTGNGTYRCNANSLSLAPGASAKLRLNILVPKSFKGTRIVHAKDMIWPDSKVKDRNPKNDHHESIITIEQPKEPTTPPPPVAGRPDLAISKTARTSSCVSGQPCGFSIVVSSVGTAAYTGQIVVSDIITPSNATLSYAGPSPWSCSGGGGTRTCTYPSTTLAPGASKTLSLTFVTPQSQYRTGRMQNCAALSWGAAGGSSILAVQQALVAQGLNPGRPDGSMGAKTRRAIREYQKRKGLPVTGRIDAAFIARLLGGRGDSNPANDRDCASVSLRGVTPTPTPVPEPVPLSCPSDYRVYTDKYQIPKGWQIIPRQSGNIVFYCAKPPTLGCPSGYTPYKNRNKVPKGWQVITRQSGNQVLFCAKPPVPTPTISCSNGKVVSGNCICPQGWKRQQVGTFAYRCIKPTPTISCSNGKVVSGNCICPKGWKRQQVGTFAYRCIKPTPSISCSNGKVISGNCICPKGWKRQQVGTFAYRCIKPGPSQSTPQIKPQLQQPILKLPPGFQIKKLPNKIQ